MTTRGPKGVELRRDIERRADALLKATVAETTLAALEEQMQEAYRQYQRHDSWVARLAWVRARRAWQEAGGTDER